VPLRVALAVRDGALHLDFAGTSPMVAGNVNCPIQVTRAAALFVLRALLDDDVPTNEGIARPIHIVTPEDCCLAARSPAAVAAGNVEMSQRITDLLFAALAAAGVDVPAQGQGTMNNVTFGGAGWTFYETLGGGQGASARGPGPSGVHVGMSNTRNTPIESARARVPDRHRAYALRRGSGGGASTAAAMASCGGIACWSRAPSRCSPSAAREPHRAPRAAAPARWARTCSTANRCPPSAAGSSSPATCSRSARLAGAGGAPNGVHHEGTKKNVVSSCLRGETPFRESETAPSVRCAAWCLLTA
jgi:N-methylhydantoinase B